MFSTQHYILDDLKLKGDAATPPHIHIDDRSYRLPEVLQSPLAGGAAGISCRPDPQGA